MSAKAFLVRKVFLLECSNGEKWKVTSSNVIGSDELALTVEKSIDGSWMLADAAPEEVTRAISKVDL